ncbi:uncharacterized protein LALA0_S06e03576g [Lachancea lanzarotensis]|uniref:LALA0S06e03576g1_1 n=1 Tax=Lachancea lanzarotensis TaxID=1245769 RepID=A0A0C7NB56_9SACH|nr:uncharacterized protein LALA0_S06e03576g [Lachancea lanzarotensis]CEP62777.1 LALA0S06e03576g1_1 [Lachancea lanzarotensis]
MITFPIWGVGHENSVPLRSWVFLEPFNGVLCHLRKRPVPLSIFISLHRARSLRSSSNDYLLESLTVLICVAKHHSLPVVTGVPAMACNVYFLHGRTGSITFNYCVIHILDQSHVTRKLPYLLRLKPSFEPLLTLRQVIPYPMVLISETKNIQTSLSTSVKWYSLISKKLRK